jgi:PucR family transcriptional regulator, purine catabolism regulatory protein
MLTVASLVAELGLELAAGEDAAESPVRWVHIAELPDPTPWLSGGELLLTTGLALGDPAAQRAFVRRLADHQLAGLGFGTGFDHAELPVALVAEARELGFPLFEVPYETPFIAITEKAFARLVNEHYETLRRATALHRRLERLVLDERGLGEVVRALAAAIGGSVAVLDARGEPIAAHDFRRALAAGALDAVRAEVAARTEPVAFAPAGADVAGRALALPVAGGVGAAPAWLVAVRDSGGLADLERLVLQQAVTVVALELMRQRVVRETERRLAGDVLADALAGRVEGRELEARLRPFGIGEAAAVLVFEVDDPLAAEAPLAAALARAGAAALVAVPEAAARERRPPARLVCAAVDRGDPVELARAGRAALGGAVRAAASRARPAAELRTSFHEARCALEAARLRDGDAPDVATHRDLGAFQLLLGLHDEDALRAYRESVLGPLERDAGEYGDELVRSLEAFIEENGQWERAARALPCHRHTLRYRIRRVEELTGRDLGSARDRVELWLALRARELVG